MSLTAESSVCCSWFNSFSSSLQFYFLPENSERICFLLLRWSERALNQQRSFCLKLKGWGWTADWSPSYAGVREQETQLWAFLLHAGMDTAFVCFFPEPAIFVSIVLVLELPSVWAHVSPVCPSVGQRPVMKTTCWPKHERRRRQTPLALFLSVVQVIQSVPDESRRKQTDRTQQLLEDG